MSGFSSIKKWPVSFKVVPVTRLYGNTFWAKYLGSVSARVVSTMGLSMGTQGSSPQSSILKTKEEVATDDARISFELFDRPIVGSEVTLWGKRYNSRLHGKK